jgi:hypothetical protein
MGATIDELERPEAIAVVGATQRVAFCLDTAHSLGPARVLAR